MKRRLHEVLHIKIQAEMTVKKLMHLYYNIIETPALEATVYVYIRQLSLRTSLTHVQYCI
jgi:hypothetical protein